MSSYINYIKPYWVLFKSQIFFIGILFLSVFINSIGNVFWYRINKEIKSFAYLFSLGILTLFYTIVIILFQIIVKSIVYLKKWYNIKKKNRRKSRACWNLYLKETLFYPVHRFCRPLSKIKNKKNNIITLGNNIDDENSEIELTTQYNDNKHFSNEDYDNNIMDGDYNDDDDDNDNDNDDDDDDNIKDNENKKDNDKKNNNNENKKPSIVYRHYTLMAFFDLFLNIFALVPVLYFSPVFVIIFHQLSIPLNIIFSYFILKRRYSIGQVFSIILIIMAIIIASEPTFESAYPLVNNTTTTTIVNEYNKTNSSTPSTFNMFNDDNENDDNFTIKMVENNYSTIKQTAKSEEYDDYTTPLTESEEGVNFNSQPPTQDELKTRNIIMIIYFLAMKIISALITIYREFVYQRYDLDIVEANVIISLNQFPMSWLALFIFFIPFPDYIPIPHFKTYEDFINYIKNGFTLFFLTIFQSSSPPSLSSSSVNQTSYYSSSSVIQNDDNNNSSVVQKDINFLPIIIIYVIFLVFNNTLDTAILKKLNSTFIVLIQVVVFVTTVFFLNFKLFAGDAQATMTPSEIIAVILAITSTSLYWFFSKKQEQENLQNLKIYGVIPKKNNKNIHALSTSEIITTTPEMSHGSSPALVDLLSKVIEFEKFEKRSKIKNVNNNINNINYNDDDGDDNNDNNNNNNKNDGSDKDDNNTFDNKNDDNNNNNDNYDDDDNVMMTTIRTQPNINETNETIKRFERTFLNDNNTIVKEKENQNNIYTKIIQIHHHNFNNQ